MSCTRQILDLINEGILNAADVALMCMKYMGEDDVADMARANDIDLVEDSWY